MLITFWRNIYWHQTSKIKSHKEVTKQSKSRFFLVLLLSDGRTRIRGVQKQTDLDQQHCKGAMWNLKMSSTGISMWSSNIQSISFSRNVFMNHVIRTAIVIRMAMNYYKNSASFLWWSQASATPTVKAANCCVSGGLPLPPPLVAAGLPPPPERKILALQTGTHGGMSMAFQIIAHLEIQVADRKGLQTLLHTNEDIGNTMHKEMCVRRAPLLLIFVPCGRETCDCAASWASERLSNTEHTRTARWRSRECRECGREDRLSRERLCNSSRRSGGPQKVRRPSADGRYSRPGCLQEEKKPGTLSEANFFARSCEGKKGSPLCC